MKIAKIRIPQFLVVPIVAIVSLVLVIVTAYAIVLHLDSMHGDASLLGFSFGSIIMIGVMLLFLITAAIVWWGFRGRRRNTTPPATAPTATNPPAATPPAPPTPSAPAKKKTPWLRTILVWGFLLIIFSLSCVRIWEMRVNTPQAPQLRCSNWKQVDKLGKGNFSKSSADQVSVDPGSDTQLCFGEEVTLPTSRSWQVWDAQYDDPDAEKDGCVAWFQYDGVDEIFGPYYGGRSLAISNMPSRWRIATNCRITYYQRG